jgi:hypothetical protein
MEHGTECQNFRQWLFAPALRGYNGKYAAAELLVKAGANPDNHDSTNRSLLFSLSEELPLYKGKIIDRLPSVTTIGKFRDRDKQTEAQPFDHVCGKGRRLLLPSYRPPLIAQYRLRRQLLRSFQPSQSQTRSVVCKVLDRAPVRAKWGN